MEIKIIYEDKDVLVVDKPAGVVVFEEGKNPSASSGHFLINELIKMYPELKKTGEAPRYGVVHRLDKDTSGILLVAKSSEALIFLQKKFINREVEKKYTALVCGNVKDNFGEIITLIGRAKNDPRKQRVFMPGQKKAEGKREAITKYKVLRRFKDYTLLEVQIKTGRKHQIRCHLSYIHCPIAGDKLYGFKNSLCPEGLTRQFLHAGYLKIGLQNGKAKEFRSELPEELQQILNNLKF